MTVSSQTSRVDYAGDGVTAIFPVPFYFLENTHLKVILSDDVTGAETVLVLDTDYTVTGAGVLAGGSITVPSEPAVGFTLTILRSVPKTQETDYVPNDPFPAESHERALDKLTMIAQEQSTDIAGAIKVAVSDPEPARLPPATSRALKLMGFNNAGDPIAVVAAEGSAAALALDLLNNSDPSKGAGQVARSTRVVDSIADLRAGIPGAFNGDMVSVTDWHGGWSSYSSPVPVGGGLFAWNSSSTAADNNGTVIAVAGVATGRWIRTGYLSVNPDMFGARGDNLTDDYQAWVDCLAVAKARLLSIEMRREAIYRVSNSIVIDFSVTIKFNGSRLKPFPGSPVRTKPLLYLNNTTNVNIYDPIINMEYLELFSSGFGVFNCQYCNIYSPAVSRTRVAYEVGDKSSATNSENNFFGATVFGTPTALLHQGHNSVTTFVGAQFVGSNNSDVSQNGIQVITVRNLGGGINFVGGEVISPSGITAGTIGGGVPINLYMTPNDYTGTPDAGGTGDGWYGRINCNGTFLEYTGYQVYTQRLAVANPEFGDLTFTGCGWFTGNDVVPFALLDDGYDGSIKFSNNRSLKTGAVRTQPNVFCNSPDTKVFTDAQSWGNGFAPFTSVVGGIVHHSNRIVLNASNTSSMSYVSNVAQVNSYAGNTIAARDGANFNGSVFTVPNGGYHTVTIECNHLVTTTGTGTFEILKNGAAVATSIGSRAQSISFTDREAPAGTTYSVRVTISGAAGTGNATQNTFKISAANAN